MKKKTNPALLNEELKKYKLLSEYNFYKETQEEPKKINVIGDSIDEADDVPTDLKPEDEIGNEPIDQEIPDSAKDIAADLGVSMDEPMDEPTEEPMDEPTEEPMGAEDEVEIDVTSIVKSTEEAKKSADLANQKSDTLLQKLGDLEKMVDNINNITTKIDTLEKEIIKRNPTPVEKLEMRSLSSFPFNQKLTDYWSDKKGPYDVMGDDKKPKEYVLTKQDIDSDYSDRNIMQSFSVPDNPYDEETIKDYDE